MSGVHSRPISSVKFSLPPQSKLTKPESKTKSVRNINVEEKWFQTPAWSFYKENSMRNCYSLTNVIITWQAKSKSQFSEYKNHLIGTTLCNYRQRCIKRTASMLSWNKSHKAKNSSLVIVAYKVIAHARAHTHTYIYICALQIILKFNGYGLGS